MTVQRSMYIWEKRYNTAMLYRYPKSKKYPYEIPTKSYIPGYDTKVYKLLSIIFSVIGMIPILVCAIIFFAIN